MLAEWKSKRDPRGKGGASTGSPALNFPFLLRGYTHIQGGCRACHHLLAASDISFYWKTWSEASLTGLLQGSLIIWIKEETKCPAWLFFFFAHL